MKRRRNILWEDQIDRLAERLAFLQQTTVSRLLASLIRAEAEAAGSESLKQLEQAEAEFFEKREMARAADKMRTVATELGSDRLDEALKTGKPPKMPYKKGRSEGVSLEDYVTEAPASASLKDFKAEPSRRGASLKDLEANPPSHKSKTAR